MALVKYREAVELDQMDTVLKRFIVFEGLDGCGKSTQQRLLREALENRGMKVWETYEPTDGAIGVLVRKVLRGEVKATAKSLALLYSADRDNHLYGENGLISHLEMGEAVISGRYFYSSIAYQSVAVEEAFVREINSFPHPEVVIYLDCPVEKCLERIEKRGEGKELFDRAEYLSRVKENFDRCLSSLPEGVNLFRVDATADIETIHQQILKFTLNCL